MTDTELREQLDKLTCEGCKAGLPTEESEPKGKGLPIWHRGNHAHFGCYCTSRATEIMELIREQVLEARLDEAKWWESTKDRIASLESQLAKVKA